jgi:hypothetical protein
MFYDFKIVWTFFCKANIGQTYCRVSVNSRWIDIVSAKLCAIEVGLESAAMIKEILQISIFYNASNELQAWC